ncbi:uncharacterized protein EV420DRAFT_806906 [Desarmillaria tabescens]|uniref:Uncharacterized protein n=1 Tax=Armillaria tabescens TaxID=1929756 RepID=A0AA39TTK7_ARMTA|nr:uncharacterized protein EV420DRAFT_806906 [Desarmillaria tabescens]KAK0466018.1 hypothetical protein EV420DRAFT_806906 [Desarmillaria tabescens]
MKPTNILGVCALYNEGMYHPPLKYIPPRSTLTRQSSSSMASDLPATEIAFIVQELDTSLNANILDSLLHGVYTGIVAVTLWNIFIASPRPNGKAIVAIIIILHILTSINLAFQWSYMRSTLVDNAQNLWTKYLRIYKAGDISFLATGITSTVCTILADSTMIWRCWMVWGRCWLTTLLPALCLVSAIVFKIIFLRCQVIDGAVNDLLNPVLYASFSLATTLWCTLLIIYRVWTVGRARERGLGAYRHVVEVLIESSALYSASLILFVAFFAHNDWAANYLDPITGIARGVAPTLLVGCVAAGHAHSDDSWQGSIVTSLRFGHGQARASAQEDTLISISLYGGDLEDQPDGEGNSKCGSQENGMEKVALDDKEAGGSI